MQFDRRSFVTPLRTSAQGRPDVIVAQENFLNTKDFLTQNVSNIHCKCLYWDIFAVHWTLDSSA